MADVQTNAFMLSSATLMIAPAFTTPVFDLIPATHSVGMARDVSVKVDSSLVQLKNGVAQTVVDARRTNVEAMISATIYEVTTKNLQRASALASGTAVQVKRGVLSSSVSAAAVSLSVTSDPIPGEAASAITATGDIPSGSTISIQRTDGEEDYVFPTVTSGAATGTGPYTVPIAGAYAIPAGMSFPAGSKVWIITPVGGADTTADDLFGVKITGTLSNYGRPVTILAPKVRISKGFQLSFTETDYGGMPFEMTPFVLSAGEATGRLSEIGTKRSFMVYAGA